MARIDMTGEKYGSWTVLRFHGLKSQKHAEWVCRCVCGTEKPVIRESLIKGKSMSCGCKIVRRTKHRMAGSRLYNVWHSMKSRCNNPNRKNYDRYGGRGISVCQRWTDSFEAFHEDMGDPPSDEHSIDRIDNDGDYTPENCRWATRSQQQRNQRSSRMLTFNGATLSIHDWSDRTGINVNTIRARLRLGWSVFDALTTHPATSTKG